MSLKLFRKFLILVIFIILYNGNLYGKDFNSSKASESKQKSQFKIFDSTLYKNKPDLMQYGIRPIKIIYEWDLWERWGNYDKNSVPKREDITKIAYELTSLDTIVVINIEIWPQIGEDVLVQDSLAKYIKVIKWFKELLPNTMFGYYGNPPVIDYWRAIAPLNSKKHQEWRADNKRLEPLAKFVDVLFPSAYTFYFDQLGWQKHAIAQINAAREYNNRKPVYVFLWPQFHYSTKIIGGKFLKGDYWKTELDTALKYADGIVIWGGDDQEWNENAEWWQITKSFLSEMNINKVN
jgi:hypothetical protein